MALLSGKYIWKREDYWAKGCHGRTIFQLYIPLEWRSFMSSYTSSLTFACVSCLLSPHFTVFFFFPEIGLPGFFIRILYFKLIISLCIIFFSFFSFLLLLYHKLRGRIRLLLLVICISLCVFKACFSFLRYWFSVSSSKISYLKMFEADFSFTWFLPFPVLCIFSFVAVTFLSSDSI